MLTITRTINRCLHHIWAFDEMSLSHAFSLQRIGGRRSLCCDLVLIGIENDVQINQSSMLFLVKRQSHHLEVEIHRLKYATTREFD